MSAFSLPLPEARENFSLIFTGEPVGLLKVKLLKVWVLPWGWVLLPQSFPFSIKSTLSLQLFTDYCLSVPTHYWLLFLVSWDCLHSPISSVFREVICPEFSGRCKKNCWFSVGSAFFLLWWQQWQFPRSSYVRVETWSPNNNILYPLYVLMTRKGANEKLVDLRKKWKILFKLILRIITQKEHLRKL